MNFSDEDRAADVTQHPWKRSTLERVMKQHANLVQKYIDANEEQRIGLFLAYREFRDIFAKIDKEELENCRSEKLLHGVEKRVKNSLPEKITNSFRRWLNFCKSRCC